VYNLTNGTCFSSNSTVGGPPTVELELKEIPLFTLHNRPPDDGLRMAPKHVEAW
jgi:hypothetical protein